MSCRDGVDFTNYMNNLSACRLCSQCYPGRDHGDPLPTVRMVGDEVEIVSNGDSET